MMTTTNPTLPVLGSNMNLHSDKLANNCLLYTNVTPCSALQCLILKRENLSGTYSWRSDVNDKVTSSNDQTTWKNTSYRKMWSVTVCESLTWYCPACNQSSHQLVASHHTNLTHTAFQTLYCPACSQSSHQPVASNHTNLTHTAFQTLYCPACSQSSHQPVASNHTNLTHTAIQTLYCPACSQSSYQPVDSHHTNLTHTAV
jgi:uncharacterized protein YbaR (Trm112 family)